MSTIRYTIIAILFCCSFGTILAGGPCGDYKFNQDRLMMTSANIMIISSFDEQDHITAYNDYGVRLWNISFYPKILSWGLKDGRLYVFSKSRLIESTYLTCIDPLTGSIIWERP